MTFKPGDKVTLTAEALESISLKDYGKYYTGVLIVKSTWISVGGRTWVEVFRNTGSKNYNDFRIEQLKYMHQFEIEKISI